MYSFEGALDHLMTSFSYAQSQEIDRNFSNPPYFAQLKNFRINMKEHKIEKIIDIVNNALGERADLFERSTDKGEMGKNIFHYLAYVRGEVKESGGLERFSKILTKQISISPELFLKALTQPTAPNDEAQVKLTPLSFAIKKNNEPIFQWIKDQLIQTHSKPPQQYSIDQIFSHFSNSIDEINSSYKLEQKIIEKQVRNHQTRSHKIKALNENREKSISIAKEINFSLVRHFFDQLAPNNAKSILEQIKKLSSDQKIIVPEGRSPILHAASRKFVQKDGKQLFCQFFEIFHEDSSLLALDGKDPDEKLFFLSFLAKNDEKNTLLVLDRVLSIIKNIDENNSDFFHHLFMRENTRLIPEIVETIFKYVPPQSIAKCLSHKVDDELPLTKALIHSQDSTKIPGILQGLYIISCNRDVMKIITKVYVDSNNLLTIFLDKIDMFWGIYEDHHENYRNIFKELSKYYPDVAPHVLDVYNKLIPETNEFKNLREENKQLKRENQSLKNEVGRKDEHIRKLETRVKELRSELLSTRSLQSSDLQQTKKFKAESPLNQESRSQIKGTEPVALSEKKNRSSSPIPDERDEESSSSDSSELLEEEGSQNSGSTTQEVSSSSVEKQSLSSTSSENINLNSKTSLEKSFSSERNSFSHQQAGWSQIRIEGSSESEGEESLTNLREGIDFHLCPQPTKKFKAEKYSNKEGPSHQQEKIPAQANGKEESVQNAKVKKTWNKVVCEESKMIEGVDSEETDFSADELQSKETTSFSNKMLSKKKEDRNQIGRKAEKIAYDWLKEHYESKYNTTMYETLNGFNGIITQHKQDKQLQVIWHNKQFEKEPNKDACFSYDILIEKSFENKKKKKYVEVKGTGNSHPTIANFSKNELERMAKYRERYVCFRVYDVNNNSENYKYPIERFYNLYQYFPLTEKGLSMIDCMKITI